MTLTTEGLTIKSLATIRQEMRDSLVTKLGTTINTEDDSVIAQIYDPVANQISDMWQAAQSVYQAMDPNTASEESLDRACALVGITRLAATRSFVDAQTFVGTQGTVIPAGTLLQVDGTEDRFNLLEELTLSTSACISSTAEITTVSNSTNYEITIDTILIQITSDADATKEEIADALKVAINNSSSIDVTCTDHLDGTFTIVPDDGITDVDISYGAGITVNSVSCSSKVRAVDYGPIIAPAGSLSEIATPVPGLDSTINPLDATKGRNIESDPELRTRRRRTVSISGDCTIPAIQAKLIEIPDVLSAKVIENETAAPDVDGRPPHSFESIVLGGDDQDIAELIWENKAAGIQTHGSTTVAYIDTENNSRFVKFSRPTEIYMHVEVTYDKYTEEDFPANAETLIAAAVLAYGESLSIGNDVLPERFKGPIFAATPGLASLTVKVAPPADPGGPLDPPGAYQTDLFGISDLQMANFDSGRIIVQETT